MLDPMRTYRVAIIDFLLTGVEQKLGFLKRGDPDLRVIGEFRDIRLAAMAELRRAYPPQP